MTTLTLGSGYFIDIDPLNYTLRQRYTGKGRDGVEKEAVRTCGYYGRLGQALERYVELFSQGDMDGEVLDIEKYTERIEKASEKAVQALSAALEDDGR